MRLRSRRRNETETAALLSVSCPCSFASLVIQEHVSLVSQLLLSSLDIKTCVCLCLYHQSINVIETSSLAIRCMLRVPLVTGESGTGG